MALGPLTMALGQRSCSGTGARHMALGHLQSTGAGYMALGPFTRALGPLTMALGQRSCLGTGARHMALGHLQGHGGHGRHWGRIHGFGAIYKGTGANYMALGPLTLALGQRSCLGTGATGALELSRHWL